MFFQRRHFAEGGGESVRQEQRIIAETGVAARRPDDVAIDAAFEFLDVPVRPGETQSRDEMRAALIGRYCAAFDQQRLDAIHRKAKVLVRSGPARRMNARLAIEGLDHQA